MLEKLRMITLTGLGNAGERQSSIIAVSLKISAASRYILHSGSRLVPSLCAKRMVAILPALSCKTESSNAAVGDAEASPTPTPVWPNQHTIQISVTKVNVVVASLYWRFRDRRLY
jgi:hypothetical protein